MQSITDDFYKRFTHDGGIAQELFIPASVRIFGSGRNSCPEVGLRLSFGATVAYRPRTDGRIVLSRTDSDTIQSVNIHNRQKYHCAAWAEEIFNAILSLPLQSSGIQMLLHTDVGLPEFAPRILCAVSAAAKPVNCNLSLQALLRSARFPAYYTASFFPERRVSIANIQTYDSLSYKLLIPGKKIIIIKTENHRKQHIFPDAFSSREAKRINNAAACLEDGFTDGFRQLMCQASRDMLRTHPNKKAEALFDIILDFSESVRILPDYSGAVVFIDDNAVDDFIRTAGDKYEKKAGIRPAFYISD